jgi:hypothetical protein
MVDIISNYDAEPFELVFSVPPRHSKTQTLLHFIAWVLKQRPWTKIGYISYAEGVAVRMSGQALAIARRAGIELVRETSKEWVTSEEGGCYAAGIGGQLTSMGFDILIVDDPTKDRATAESRVYRDKTYDWFTSTAYTRLEKGGSIIVCGTRWHEDDLQGRLIAGHEDADPWQSVIMPALADGPEGNETIPLWREQFGLKQLRKIRATVGPYDWSALYQGQPQPKDARLFGDVGFYDPSELAALMRSGHRVAIGMDLGMTGTGDWSVLVTMVRVGDRFYVDDVIREQRKPEKFVPLIQQAKRRRMRARIRWYGTAHEVELASFVQKESKVLIDAVATNVPKRVRAIPYSAAWNDGRVLLPADLGEWRNGELVREGRGGPVWVEDFLKEHRQFSGIGDREDDQVDASVAAFDQLEAGHAGALPEGPEYETRRRI